MTSATFVVRFARRIPDPVLSSAERHIFMCAVEDIPANVPKDPNPRSTKPDRRIYREVEQHLVNEEGTPNTFHLKNKGITILAEKVTKRDEEHYDVSFGESHGIVDGAHTYELIVSNKDNIKDINDVEDDKITQFVKVEVLTGIDRNLVAEIAGGLNTAVQVQQMSLANLDNQFEWIKTLLRDTPYFSKIAFRENEPSAVYDVRDILVWLDLFNIAEFSNDDSSYPIRAYTSKEAVLGNYIKHSAHYKRLAPILKDILHLHDLINLQAADLYNKHCNGKAGGLAFVKPVSKLRNSKDAFLFLSQPSAHNVKQGIYRLDRGALFPMLGAFRWMVRVDPETEAIGWQGGFAEVYNLWQKTGGELMRATQETSQENGRNVNAIGKSRNHWANLHNLVAKRNLMSQR